MPVGPSGTVGQATVGVIADTEETAPLGSVVRRQSRQTLQRDRTRRAATAPRAAPRAGKHARPRAAATAASPSSRTSRNGHDFPWAHFPDDKLLDMRLCDLDLTIEGTELELRIEELYAELARRGITYRPYFWLSNEWFTPDAHTGVAIPFYLAHPRLKQLERKQMLEVEGGTPSSCMRILRHEVGHVLDNAYRLHRRRRYRELFGSWSAPYPDFYQPKPYSRSYVIHLDMWYAQAHPAEDFAETFAVWLRPGSSWRQRYKGWPALQKLQYVDDLMANDIAGERPAVVTRRYSRPLKNLRHTLREHYREKRLHYIQEDWPDFYDSDLRRLFSDDPKYRRNPMAASFLRSIKPELRRMVSRWTGQYQYTIEQALDDIIARCQELHLRLVRSPRRTTTDAVVMLTVQTMNYLHDGHHRVAL
jgi:hypothetical protein